MNTRIKVLFFIAAIATSWTSCKKGDDAPIVSTGQSVAVFFNLSANNINFYINGTRINNTTTYYPGGTLGYVNVTGGLQNYSVKVDGSSTPFFNKPLEFKTELYDSYSVYVAGQTADDVFYLKDAWFKDTISTHAAQYAQIRFVNASASAGNLKFVKTGKADTTQFDNVAYKTTTNFTSIPIGVRYIGVYRAAYPTAPKIDTVTIAAGKIYTFYAYGTGLSTGNKGIFTGLFTNQ